ncbi:hypothetical protein Tco_0457503, partial [Tanacetum coccineum]
LNLGGGGGGPEGRLEWFGRERKVADNDGDIVLDRHVKSMLDLS